MRAHIHVTKFVLFTLTLYLGACASATFTQQGVVSGEEICYEGECFTTIKWEDGTFTNVKTSELPASNTVYRHCTLRKDNANEKHIIDCTLDIYERPIKLFDKTQEEVENKMIKR